MNDYLELHALYHHGIKGQKWGIRRFQNEDGTLTPEGRERYGLDTNAINDYEKEKQKVIEYWDTGSDAEKHRNEAIKEKMKKVYKLVKQLNSNKTFKKYGFNVETSADEIDDHDSRLCPTLFLNNSHLKYGVADFGEYSDLSGIFNELPEGEDYLKSSSYFSEDRFNEMISDVRNDEELSRLLKEVDRSYTETAEIFWNSNYGRDKAVYENYFNKFGKEQAEKVKKFIEDKAIMVKTENDRRDAAEARVKKILAIVGSIGILAFAIAGKAYERKQK